MEQISIYAGLSSNLLVRAKTGVHSLASPQDNARSRQKRQERVQHVNSESQNSTPT